MNVFLSWSGTLSHEVAQALVGWLPQVIQAVKPWLSSQDIEKGARWFEEIGESLSKTDFGVLCLTATNITAPWILFEAGALSKSLGQARVCPLLINIKNIDLQGPLAQFNTSGTSQADVRRLVDTLNARLSVEQKRTESQLNEAFEVWWPHLERKFEEALKHARDSEHQGRPSPKRKADDVLDELLELARSTAQQLSRLSAEQSHEVLTPNRAYPRNSVGQLAAELNRSAEALMEQLLAAGIAKNGPEDPMTESDKEKLLNHLRSVHSTGGQRRKITLTRKQPGA
jgi:hypothetical protein